MFLRQSTASQTRLTPRFVDDTDFKTSETGLTIANTDVKLSKNGAASVNKNSGGGTHIEGGRYALTFDATDTNTVGELAVGIVISGALPVEFKFFVLEEAVYDALFAASAPGYVSNAPVNVAQFGGTNGTFSGGRPEVNTTHVAGTAQTAKDLGAINVTNLNTLSSHDPGETIMGATDLGTGSGFTSLASATNLAAAKTVVDAIKLKTDNLPASPAATGDAMTLTSAYDAAKTAADATTVASSFTSVLSKLLKYVQLMVRKDAAIATDNATELTAINANGGSGAGSFDNTTDAEQAIRDRGDAAWITATGFSTLDAAGVRTAVGLASANLDTQLAAKAEPGDAMALTADALDAASLAASAGTEIAAAVQTSAATTPLPSDVKKINATTITGTGVLGDEFGPA